ncbi:uncharacterized protein LOC142338271 [Convolutriloba macropyga]|uniref:uncharacterized protein LOC142338271 n=1 Tax=Convolutriloba macropyga TaxID=536237 RepID=UPI003F51B2A0
MDSLKEKSNRGEGKGSTNGGKKVHFKEDLVTQCDVTCEAVEDASAREEALVNYFNDVTHDYSKITQAIKVYSAYRADEDDRDTAFARIMFHKTQDPKFLWMNEKAKERSAMDRKTIVSAVNTVTYVLEKVEEAIWNSNVNLRLPRCLIEASRLTYLFLYCAIPKELRDDLLPPVPERPAPFFQISDS